MISFILLLASSVLGFNPYNLNIQADWNRQVYVSKQIGNVHLDDIQEAINRFNVNPNYKIVVTEGYDANEVIRIQYLAVDREGGRSMGNTAITSSLESDGRFRLYRNTISFNPDLNGETLVCVLLHELLHAHGLDHSVKSRIMSFAVTVTPQGEIIQPLEPCFLNDDDLQGLKVVSQQFGNRG